MKIPPRTIVQANFTQWVSEIQVPYEGSIVYSFIDGSEWIVPVHGEYSGVVFSNVTLSLESRVMHAGEQCPTSEVRVIAAICCTLLLGAFCAWFRISGQSALKHGMKRC